MQRILIKETITCAGEKVKLCGWVNTRRDHGSIVFFDLRDISGLVQIVLKPELAKDVRPEWVVCIEGLVKARPEKMVNPNFVTGKIEIEAESLEVLSEAKTLPIHLFEKEEEGHGHSEHHEPVKEIPLVAVPLFLTGIISIIMGLYPDYFVQLAKIAAGIGQ